MSSRYTVSGKNTTKNTILLTPEITKKLTFGSKKEQPLPVIDNEENLLFICTLMREYNFLIGVDEWLTINHIDKYSSIHIELISDPKDKSPQIRLIPEYGTQHIEHNLNLGKYIETKGVDRHLDGTKFSIDPTCLMTHAFVCGMTGSGKTYCMKVIIEEALKAGIPVVAIDLKGDIASLGVQQITLPVPNLAPFAQEENSAKALSTAWAINNKSTAINQLQGFNISESEANEFSNLYDFKLLSPGANYGIPISLANQLNPPLNIKDLKQKDPDLFSEMCTSVTESFFGRLYPAANHDSYRNERAFFHTLMRYCWENGMEISGIRGLELIRDFIERPPFTEVAGESVEELMRGGRSSRLKDRITTLMSAPEDRWFQGVPLTIDLLINKRNGKTPLTVISVPSSSQFDDRAYIVSQICFTIVSWMLGQGEASFPRLLLFIDEIGAQGGETSLFPSYPRNPASKRFLSQLIRQGRSFGVCALLGTQNPTDIDYKALSNVGLWMVSNIKNSRDRNNILQTMYIQDMRKPTIEGWLARDAKGKFVIKSPDKSDVYYVQMRSLHTLHQALDRNKLTLLKDIWPAGKEFEIKPPPKTK